MTEIIEKQSNGPQESFRIELKKSDKTTEKGGWGFSGKYKILFTDGDISMLMFIKGKNGILDLPLVYMYPIYSTK